MDTTTAPTNIMSQITQSLAGIPYFGNLQNMTPPIITTSTTTDYIPDMSKLTKNGDGDINDIQGAIPSLAESTLVDTSSALNKKEITFTDKEFSRLTINQVYDNTLKTTVAILNDISETISEKEVLTNAEFRRRLVDIFLIKERRMYVGILLIIFSFILYFIDSST